MQISTCPDCEGAGERATPCNTCGGDGRVRRTKKINLNVPPGVDNGSRLRVRGEGSSGRKGGTSACCFVILRRMICPLAWQAVQATWLAHMQHCCGQIVDSDA